MYTTYIEYIFLLMIEFDRIIKKNVTLFDIIINKMLQRHEQTDEQKDGDT